MEALTSQPTLSANDYRKYFEKGISYPTYRENMMDDLVNGKEKFNAHYVPMNWQRMSRLEKSLSITDRLQEVINQLHNPLRWLVISEHWCGDASQLLTLFNIIAEASGGKIALRIVYRDENLELMDEHLTNNGRSIPKLIQLDADYQVTGTWGPRPAEAQQLVTTLKADPLTAPTYAEKLHKWYAVDKTITTQNELIQLLEGATSSTTL